MLSFYTALFLMLFVSIISWLMTKKVRDYALKQRILDIPNERSSHVRVTPRGGGLAFVIVFLVGLSGLFWMGFIELKLYLALVGGGALIATVGWKDDKTGLTARLRMVFHFISASWAVFFLGGVPSITLGFTDMSLSWLGSIMVVIGIVWMINLYNFMDGIDGIAGTEAISVAMIVGGFLLWQQYIGQAMICFLLASVVAGFLVWNWAPARIFMGDVGSGFLGYIFAVMALASEKSGAVPLIVWLTLLGVFVIDATFTLIKRLVGGEKLYEAHRKHVYQLAVQVGYSHKQVTTYVLLTNLMLGILAILAMINPKWLLFIALGSAFLLTIIQLILAKHFNSQLGKKEAILQTAELISGETNMEAAAMLDLD